MGRMCAWSRQRGQSTSYLLATSGRRGVGMVPVPAVAARAGQPGRWLWWRQCWGPQCLQRCCSRPCCCCAGSASKLRLRQKPRAWWGLHTPKMWAALKTPAAPAAAALPQSLTAAGTAALAPAAANLTVAHLRGCRPLPACMTAALGRGRSAHQEAAMLLGLHSLQRQEQKPQHWAGPVGVLACTPQRVLLAASHTAIRPP